MLVVGLTGGIASGKSTVSRKLRDKYKLPIVDADKIARQVVEPGQNAYHQIVSYFKDKISDLLLEDRHLNRAALGKWVFSHKEDLKALNGITHPAVRYAMLKEIGYYYLKGYRMCVLDVPLLFEGNLDSICGVTISVICKQELQLERLMARNPELSEEDAKNRLRSQMSAEERITRSDYILQNDGTVIDLYEQIEGVIRKIQPSKLRTVLEYFPPFGVVSASSVVMSRLLMRKLQNKKFSKV
ncbi:YDR196C [Saccharomyces arboricola H-6]|uniref:YDR196C n=1 Tax=Saccharomyces arboricola (strain H-6 / AS 2.3317 / CBS 10644) TaxID=1160507 RepID=J8Q125_SACAR|nr:YDR196C [Saccharomyces arboricola H-6]